MIDLYTWPTPNGHKIHIMLEETGLPYKVFPVNISAGEQFDPDFLKISPNNRMPAMIDHDGPGGEPISIFESGAILIYLAEKSGQFLSTDPHTRYTTVQWLMWQMGGLGPMLGQAHHFRAYAEEQHEYAVNRYTNEARRLYNVMEKRLGEVPYLGGQDYSIADMACWPWTRSHERQGVDMEALPNFKRWYETIRERPAVQRGVEVLADRRSSGPISEEAREILFGAKQYQTR